MEFYFSLNDLFNQEQQDFEDNVYEVIDEVQTSKTEFKYVQVRKEYVETSFSKHEVLQLVDISQKILYEAAVGEKRLFSIINASVSHDMRNPTNSIQMQVQEQ
jgi:signal transduction histidine kinase